MTSEEFLMALKGVIIEIIIVFLIMWISTILYREEYSLWSSSKRELFYAVSIGVIFVRRRIKEFLGKHYG